MLPQEAACPVAEGGALSYFSKHFWEKNQAQMPEDNFNPQIPEPKVNQRSHMQCLSQRVGKLSLQTVSVPSAIYKLKLKP